MPSINRLYAGSSLLLAAALALGAGIPSHARTQSGTKPPPMRSPTAPPRDASDPPPAAAPKKPPTLPAPPAGAGSAAALLDDVQVFCRFVQAPSEFEMNPVGSGSGDRDSSRPRPPSMNPSSPSKRERAESPPKYEYVVRGPAQIAISVQGLTSDAVLIHVDGSGEATALPPGPLVVDVKPKASAKVRSVQGGGRADARDEEEEGGQPVDVSVPSAFQAVMPDLFQQLVSPQRFWLCVGGDQIASVKIVERKGKLRLSAGKFEKVGEAAKLPPAVADYVRTHAEKFAEYRAECERPMPRLSSDAVAVEWQAVLGQESPKQIAVRECWHCSRRPAKPSGSALACPAECPGCEHEIGCDGNNPAGCSGCARKLPTQHVVTADEARAYQRLVDALLEQQGGEGSFVELRVSIPCTHTNRPTSRWIVERAWALSSAVTLQPASPRIERVVILGADMSTELEAACEPAGEGAQKLTLQARIVEEFSGRTGPASTVPRDSLRAPSGAKLTPAKVFSEYAVVAVLSDGRVVQLRVDERTRKLQTDTPTFEQWLSVRPSK